MTETLPSNKVDQGRRQNSHENGLLASEEAVRKSPTHPSHSAFPERRPDIRPGGFQHLRMDTADSMPSDTQVISQSVYDDVIRQNKEAATAAAFDSNLGDRATLMTLHEGDSGHLDLLSGFDTINTDSANLEDNDDQSSSKLGESSPMVYQPNLFPESQRFLSKTPASAAKLGPPDTPATGTPCASRNPLATNVESSGGIMALSQVFRATQVPSSPLVNGQLSEPLSERPSPNLPIQNHAPSHGLSSPLRNLAATFPQDSSEPHLHYITMKESQSRRDKAMQERLARSAEIVYSEDQSDGEFDKEPSFVEHLRRQKTIDAETMAQFAGLTAPARSPSQRKRPASVHGLSPSGRPERRKWPVEPVPVASEDGIQEFAVAPPNVGVASEEETEQEEELFPPVSRSQDPDPSTEEDKENCLDNSQDQLDGASNAHGRLSQVLDLYESPTNTPGPPVANGVHPFPNSQGPPVDEQWGGTGRSSQVLVVKDSQKSPEDQDGDETPNLDGPWNGNGVLNSGPRHDAGLSKTTPSPSKDIGIQSSPPSESQRSRVSFRLDDHNTAARARSDSAGSEVGASTRFRIPATQEDNGGLQSIPATQSHTIFSDKLQKRDLGEKSSSMPSRIAETPIQRPESFGDVLPETSVPETSPSRFHSQTWAGDGNNDAMDQEDDDLPPVYVTTHERASRSQPLFSDSSSPAKDYFHSKIFSSPSGRQRRALTEIAADVSPYADAGRFDVDINILSADDREFRTAVAMSPTPKKKRRGNDGKGLYASDPIVPVTPRPSTFFPPPLRDHISEECEQQPTEPTKKLQAVLGRRTNPSRQADTMWDIDDSPQFHVSRKERARNLGRSHVPKQRLPKEHRSQKADVQPITTGDDKEPLPIRDELRHGDINKESKEADPGPVPTHDPKEPTPSHKELQSKNGTKGTRGPRVLDAEKPKRADTTPVNEKPPSEITVEEPKETLAQMTTREPQESTSIQEEPRKGFSVKIKPTMKSTPEDPITKPTSLRQEEQIPSAGNAPIAFNQVLAPWSGPKRAYYPATCFGKPFGTSQSRYLVKFEDSTPVEVPLGAVKRLELRIGDAVKVDVPNVPKVTHIIRGLENKLSDDELAKESASGTIPVTDIYGHSTLLLGPKQRKSLPNGGLPGPENIVKVPISRIYLDTILWNQLKDRPYTYTSVSKQVESGLCTPSDRHMTPTSPSTRLSRSIRFSSGLFTGMVFAVSYGENADTKSRIVKMILENDGRILHDGFNELFELPSNAPLATPTKSPASITSGNNNNQFRLTRGAEDVGFACLIADKHSRRPKYMQALALNLPCLSDRWIEDCVTHNRIVEWEMYLLPAGDSSYLNGATKSRFLTPYPATKARLSDTIAARPSFLSGQSVLIVMGRGKADEERRKTYLFLTYALGASRVERLPDVKSVRAACEQGAGSGAGWDWVYVDSEEKASAISSLLGQSVAGSQQSQTSQSQRPRKRKRSGFVGSFTGDSDSGGNTSVRIVSNELVCQSLILGKLLAQ